MVKKEKIIEACNIAINNVIKEGTTDVTIFNRPFEIDLLNNDDIRNSIVDDVTKKIQSNNFEEMKFNKLGQVLVPKKSFLSYRKCALTDVIDEIKYLTLVLLISESIEKFRDNRSEKRVFSYRLKLKNNSGYIFENDKYNYETFSKRVQEKSNMKNKKVTLECDISNYYDRLNLHRLESILLSIDSIDRDILKLIMDLLFFWSNRDSYGLPVGSNASRILAEAALIEVDNYLISQKIDFCRYVDDYRIFSNSAQDINYSATLLIKKLNQEGLFLNTSKTKLRDISNKNIETNSTNKLETSQIDFEVFNKIIRNYSGVIPLSFKKLRESEKNKLILKDENESIKLLKNAIVINEKDFTETVKILIAKQEFEKLLDISEIIKKLPQFIPYYIDVLIKNGSKIKPETREKIKENMVEYIQKENVSEYIKISTIRLFSDENFEDYNIIFECFRNLKRDSGDYIGRSILETLERKINRGNAIEIRDYYARADLWEKREIIKIIYKVLEYGEARPFLKNIEINSNEFFEKTLAKYGTNEKEFKKMRKLLKVRK